MIRLIQNRRVLKVDTAAIERFWDKRAVVLHGQWSAVSYQFVIWEGRSYFADYYISELTQRLRERWQHQPTIYLKQLTRDAYELAQALESQVIADLQAGGRGDLFLTTREQNDGDAQQD